MSGHMTEDYSENSLTQQQAQAKATPILLKNVRAYVEQNRQRIAQRGFIAIADLGCADGKNDTKTLQAIIDIINSNLNAVSIFVYMNDIPQTNASKIISNVSEILKVPNVYLYAKPSSFYEKLFPENYVDIFFTFTAIHWLPGKPPAPTDGFTMTTQHKFTDDESFKKWMEYQESSLQKFYQYRNQEMVQGGVLFLSTIFPWASHEDKERVLNEDVKMKNILSDLLTQYGHENISRHICANYMFRRTDEFVQILENTSKISLKPIEKDSIVADYPLYQLSLNQDVDDQQFGKHFASFRKTFQFNPFKQSMIDNGMDAKDAEDILNKYFQLMEESATNRQVEFTHSITINVVSLQKQ